MKRAGWRVVQRLLALGLIGVALVKLRSAWIDPDNQATRAAVVWHFDGRWILLSLLVTWAMYLILIGGWKVILGGWGARIGWFDATRIWMLSSLWKYVPGKIWSIASMAVMAEGVGVPGAAATGSAVVMQLLSLASGAAIAVALVGATLLRDAGIPGGPEGAIVLGVVALASSSVLLSKTALTRISGWIRLKQPLPPLTPNLLLAGLGLNALAWCGYGVSLVCLTRGTLPDVTMGWPLATGAFTASYLVGYLAFLAPGGLGVRDVTIGLLLAGPLGAVPAAALAIASRVTLTINEIGAAVPFLLLRSTPRDHS